MSAPMVENKGGFRHLILGRVVSARKTRTISAFSIILSGIEGQPKMDKAKRFWSVIKLQIESRLTEDNLPLLLYQIFSLL